MNRLLILLFIVFIALIITEQGIVKYKTQENLLRSSIRTLRPIPEGETTEIVARASDGRSWRLVKTRDGREWPDGSFRDCRSRSYVQSRGG